MGSVREEIALEVIIDRNAMEALRENLESVENTPSANERSDQIISLVCKRIEGVENPYKDEICNSYTHLKSDVYLYVIEAARDCFEEARQAILDVIKEE